MRTLLTMVQILAAFVLVLNSLSLGLRHSLGQIIITLRHPGPLIATCLASALVVPALAWGVVRVLPLDPYLAAGILVASIGLATPDALRLTELGAGRLPFAFALAVVFSLLNVVIIPAWAFLMFPVEVAFDPTGILRILLLSVALPFAAGTVVRQASPQRAPGWGESLYRLGTPLMLLAFAGMLIVLVPVLGYLLGTAALLASLTITAAALGLGYLVGGGQPDVRRSAALLTATRAYAPAILIATTNAPGRVAVLAGVAAMIVAGLVIRIPVALHWHRRYGAVSPAAGADESRRDAA